jgi:hypothetical protein
MTTRRPAGKGKDKPGQAAPKRLNPWAFHGSTVGKPSEMPQVGRGNASPSEVRQSETKADPLTGKARWA